MTIDVADFAGAQQMTYRPIIQSEQVCVICAGRVQGRKRSDARVCVGECARILARRRTKAWKDKQPFSIRKGILPIIDMEL